MLQPETQAISFLLNRAPVVDEPLRGVRVEPREVEVGGVPRVLLEDAVGGAEVGLLVAVQGAPARPEDDDGAVRDAAVPGLPSGQVVHRQPGVGVGRCPGAVYRFRFSLGLGRLDVGKSLPL